MEKNDSDSRDFDEHVLWQKIRKEWKGRRKSLSLFDTLVHLLFAYSEAGKLIYFFFFTFFTFFLPSL